MGGAGGGLALARRYARGLAEAAPKDLGRAAAALDGWRETLRYSPDLSSILSDPRLPKPARAAIARDLFGRLDAPVPLLNLVGLLIEENRFELLSPLHEAFVREREKREGILHIIVETAASLADQGRERIRSRLAESLRRHIRIEERVRPELLAGVNLRIGSRVWYGSAKHQIDQLFRFHISE